MILMLDDGHPACAQRAHEAGTGTDDARALRAFDDWRGMEPGLARTLRRLGFSAALAAPRYAAAPVPPPRRADATSPEWRPL